MLLNNEQYNSVFLPKCHDHELPHNAAHFNLSDAEGRGETGFYSVTRLRKLQGITAVLTQRRFQLPEQRQWYMLISAAPRCQDELGQFII